MVASPESIALFSLTLLSLRVLEVRSGVALRVIRAVSALVLAMVAWNAERVHYCSQVTSLATGSLCYAQFAQAYAGFRARRKRCRKRAHGHTHGQSHTHDHSQSVFR